jgi:fatty acid desaturase
MQDATAAVAPVNHFPAVRKLVADEGLFAHRPVWSIGALITNILLFVAGFAALFFFRPVWFALLDAVFLAVLSGQFGFLMHDAGHRQVFKKTWKNDVFGYIATFFNGNSFRAWMKGHNEHHDHPNHVDMDPDIDVFFLSYTEDQVDEHGSLMRYLTRFQVWYVLPIYTLVAHFMRYGGLRRLFGHHPARLIVLDMSLIVAWHIVYYGGAFFALGLWKGLLFLFVHQGLTGIYLALVFAPNHKGMPIIERNSPNLNWFDRQVMTSRNVRGHPITDLLYGGLNFQIEHHLYPTMPRLQLRRAARITKKFCQEKGVDYYETGIIRSYYEVFQLIHSIAEYARNLRRPVSVLQQQLAYFTEQLRSDLNTLKQQIPDDEIHTIALARCEEARQALSDNMALRKENILRQRKEIQELMVVVRQRLQPKQN